MKNPISKQVINHLEFLGYKVEDISGENEIDIITGVSENKSNLVFRIFKDDMSLISARYNISDSNSIITKKFLNAINLANSKSFYSKIYYLEEEDKKVALAIETFSFGYNKQAFVTIIDSLEKDIRMHLKDLEEYYSSAPKVNYGQAIVDELMDTTKDEENVSSRIGF